MGPTVGDYLNGRALTGKILKLQDRASSELAQPGRAYISAGDLCRFDLRALGFRECIGRSSNHVKDDRLLF